MPTVSDFYNSELTRLQEKQQSADEITHSNERLAALNDSYRKRYAKYVQILMVLVLAIVIYLAVVLLQKQFPVIPQLVVDVIVIVLIFLVAFYLFNAGWELYSRSLINYDEIDLPAYDSSGVDVQELAKKGQVVVDVNATSNPCVGADCCADVSGKKWNQATGKCDLAFTTLETAYTNNLITGSSFKREPTLKDVAPTQDDSLLSYSPV
jgi:ABC-type multidrug transport system fused ATPase/permease subunit